VSDPTIFNNGNPATPANPANPQTPDPYANLLGMIVNEQGSQKYNSIEDALKGAAHAQAYIAQLKAEKAELENKYNTVQVDVNKQAELERTVQELLSRQSRTEPANPASATVDATTIADLVNKTLEQRTVAERAQANQKEVATQLLNKFGAEAEAKYNAAAQELGLTVAEMNEFAAKSPKAVLKALGVSEQPALKPNTFAPAPSAVNTAAFQPQQDTFIGRNKEKARIGATTRELNQEAARARAMVDEIHASGASVHDLTDPKVYFKYFGK
jgi:hypothetical protein